MVNFITTEHLLYEKLEFLSSKFYVLVDVKVVVKVVDVVIVDVINVVVVDVVDVVVVAFSQLLELAAMLTNKIRLFCTVKSIHSHPEGTKQEFLMSQYSWTLWRHFVKWTPYQIIRTPCSMPLAELAQDIQDLLHPNKTAYARH